MSIRIAGNTEIPTLAAIRQRGYQIECWGQDDGAGGCDIQYDATKGDCSFSATSPEELLGLIAMWETRGDDWQAKTQEERDFREALIDNMVIYDADGNVIDS